MPSLHLLALLLAATGAEKSTEAASPTTPATPEAHAPALPQPPPPPLSARPADRAPAAAEGTAGTAHPAPAAGAAEAAKGEANKGEAAKGEATAEAAPDNLPHKAVAPAERAEAATPLRTLATPPSLTSRALIDELRRSGKQRQGDESALADGRQKLEALKSDIDKAREALREETKRLQGLVASGGAKASPKAVPGQPGQKEKPSPLDSLAKTTRNMKPGEAAAMMTQLDRGLAAAILARMRPADAALVLEKMEPAKSASLVALLAGKDRS